MQAAEGTNRPRPGRDAAVSLIAGAAMPVAFSPWEWSAAAILAPSALLYIWSRHTPRAAFWQGFAFGIGMFGAGVGWIRISINAFGGVNSIGAALATLLLVAYLALYPAITGWILRREYHRAGAWMLIGAAPALWVLSEWVRGWLFSGFPWLNLGYTQIDTYAAGYAPVAGTLGLSWMVVMTAGAFVVMLNGTRLERRTAIGLVAVLWSLSALLTRVDWTRELPDRLTAALVQGAIPQEFKWQEQFVTSSLERYLQLTRSGWQASIVVWPETAIPAFEHQVSGFMDDLASRAREHDVDLYVGMPTLGPSGSTYRNSVVLLPDRTAVYSKRHLVPFGEFIPFKQQLGGLFSFLHIPMSDFSPGEDGKPLIAGRRAVAGISICYEDIFGEEVIDALPEAQILINVSNDAWFGNSAAPHQHLQMARMRALETGRYMLRATNTGISAIIDEKGRASGRSIQFIPAVTTGEVRLFEGLTPYSRTGNWPVVAAAVLLIGILSVRQRRTAI